MTLTSDKRDNCISERHSADCESYLHFKENYHIRLNAQQEQTVQSIEGSILLLAVPGSVKTTVLVDRLGYMVCEKGIDPGTVLAITYNKAAAEEMRSRYIQIFGAESGKQIDFRTINSLSLAIYSHFCREIGKETRELLEGNEKKNLLSGIYREFHPDEYPTEGDILQLESTITYAKNMMLQEDQIAELDSDYPNFSSMFRRYDDILRESYRMDFDDQMVYAHWILTNKKTQALYWQKKYHYLCVDEAQDTSKIQHAIIRILAQGNNIFMVGDEDQSIYGFRAAYPEALLNFSADYCAPRILRLERNYRSTPQIVEKAQNFIRESTGRYEKTMVADRPDGKAVELISVNSIEEQYLKVLSAAQNANGETAFLYRDNESSVVLVDFFLRNNIHFRLKKPEMNFFETSVVRDIAAYLSLVINPFDTKSLRQISNKGILYLKKQQLDYAIQDCNQNQITVFDALESQMKYLPQKQRNRAKKFKDEITGLKGRKTEEAIGLLLGFGYRAYLEGQGLDYGKIISLLILAKQETDISAYLDRLRELEERIQKGFSESEKIILSTIHSSKGLEYGCVYLVDVYDGRFPSSKGNAFGKAKEAEGENREERRLFYVGITRAKNELHLFDIKGKQSSYIDSLFPGRKKQAEPAKQRNRAERQEKTKKGRSGYLQRAAEEERLRYAKELCKRQALMLEEKRKEEEAKKKAAAELAEKNAYAEVKDLFTQQETPIWDSRDVRWVQCEKCGRILPADQFLTYGGLHQVNLGVCYDCYDRSEAK